MGRAVVIASRSKKKTKQTKVVKSSVQKDETVRLSKRNRQQIFPYQSPESIEKISQQFLGHVKEPVGNGLQGNKNKVNVKEPVLANSSPSSIKSKPKVNVKVKDVPSVGKRRVSAAIKKAKAPAKLPKEAKKSTKKMLKNSELTPLSRKRKGQDAKIIAAKKRKLARSAEKAQAVTGITKAATKVTKAATKVTKAATKVTQAATDITQAAITEDTKEKKNVKRRRKAEDSPPKKPRTPKAKEEPPVGKKRRTKNQLDPKLDVTKYDKDPTYESKLEIPPISSLANSRLLIRAVLLKDNKLLKSLLSKKKFLCSVAAPRNLDPQGETAVSCAIKTGNLEAIKLLMDPKNDDNMADLPDVLLERESTGHGSNRMFGHAMRNVSVGRGGKEGNAAFLKDPPVTSGVPQTIAPHILSAGLPFVSIEKISNDLKGLMARCCENVAMALRAGQRDLAGQLVKWGNKCGGYGFNQLHEDVLVNQTEPLGPFKSVSVLKKDFHARITPLHCAAINPNVQYLAALLDVKADVSGTDRENWTVLHYAAVCQSDGPLDHILSEGAVVTNIINKDGDTPLHLACKLGRLANVQRILKHEKHRDPPGVKEEEEEEPTKKSNKFAATSSLIRVNKIGLTPVQLAAKQGHLAVLTLLLSQDTVEVNKPTAAAYDRVTPLMLAAANGHLNVVEFLAENREKFGVKLDLVDKRGRTALTHAVMNGSGLVVSYLLRLGVNHLVVDSSGNTLMHYAAAYGWYFNCKLLIQAGCPLDAANHWKVTPLAVAFMKGHMGLVNLFLEVPGADINAVVNATNGRNLLLEVCNSKPSESTMEKLKFLVTEQHAQVNVTDHDKNNPLHTVVASYKRHYYNVNLYYRTADKEDSYDAENHKWTVAGIKLLIDANCNMEAINEDNTSPITLAGKQGSFKLLLDAFPNKISLPKESDEKGFNIFHHVAMSSHTSGVQELVTQFVTKPSNLLLARELAQKVNEDGMTPMFLLLTALGGQLDDKQLSRGLWFLSFLLDKLNSDVNSGIVDEKTRQSVLHVAVKSNHAQKILPLILAKKPQLDVVNHEGQTPLLLAVLQNKEEASKLLIAAGADVNFSSDQNPSILLTCAESRSDSFALLPILIEKGADVSKVNPKTGNSALHVIASKPTAAFALESVVLLLKKGHPACSVNKNGRTALHLLLNSRGGEIDVIYDLEMTLIQEGPRALSTKDLKGRVPLHYVFNKIGENSKSFMDPIELMALIVRAMKDQGCWAGEDFKDNLKATPLHYAACVGATICTSLLLKDKPHWIDLPDQDSNTPFGLAVLYGHEGSALCMQQMNGNFTTVLDTGLDAKRAESKATSTEEILKWQPNVLEEEQDRKFRAKEQIVTILEQVVQKDWQGILHLMGESLRSSGGSIAPVIHAAIKTSRLKLAAKLLKQVTLAKDLEVSSKDGTLVHILAKHSGQAAEELVQTLMAKGVDITRGNEFNSNALVLAALHRNLGLFKPMLEHLVSSGKGHVVGRSDGFGRTLFTSLFWGHWPIDCQFESADVVKELRGFEKEETLTHFPIKFLPMPSARFLRLTVPTLADCESDNKLSPLIMSVISGHYGMVKFLLSFDAKLKIDVNLQDGKGRTAIMHAVRLNDIKMVKLLLLGSTNYDPEKDNIPWEASEVKSLVTKRAQLLSKTRVNLTLRDHEGLTVVDHLIRPSKWPFTYANSDAILELLVAAKAPLDPSVLNRATSNRIRHLVKAIQSLQGKKIEDLPEDSLDFPSEPNPLTAPVPNYLQDSKAMAEKLGQHDPKKTFSSVPDPLIGIEKDQLEVVIENEQPFDCVITKVDITYGIYGMYNFYKMQLLVHQATGLVLLFTRWGRVGDDGQYQKTPFGSLEEGKGEFKKIFMAKSGNSWDNLEGFSPMPKKYRLVKKDLRNRARPSEVKVDFEALKTAGKGVKSKLEKAVEDLVRGLCLSHEHRPSIYDRGVSIEELPFGLLTPEALQKGESLLHQIEELILKMEKLQDTPQYSKDQEQQIYLDIVDLSQEYYLTIPVFGFSSEKLSPMFVKEDVQAKQRIIQKVLHIDFASQVLLAALHNSKSQNPFDYAYSCLNVEVKLVDPESMEAQLILQAVEKTSDDSYRKPQVFNIFKVNRSGESDRINGTGIQNRHLLWHGTSDVNLLSILSKGLQVAPHEAEINGHLFGKGIYFADMFRKSQNYCDGSDYKYMFLCDVALGKIHPVTCPAYGEKSKPKPPAAFDSVKTADSEYEPNPGGAIVWQNRVMHLGEQVEKIFKDNRYHGLDYNEYVVFKPEQVSIKYMVQFKD